MLLVKLTGFCFAMQEIAFPFFLTMNKLELLKHLTLLPDNLLNIDNPIFLVGGGGGEPIASSYSDFTLDLALSFIDKLLVFRCVLIVLLVKLTGFCFAMQEIAFPLFLTMNKLELLKNLTLLPDNLLNIDNPIFLVGGGDPCLCIKYFGIVNV